MLGSDLKALYDSYQDIYEEADGISCEMIEEIVEELVEECVEFGYTLDEAATAVENAAFLFIDEAKVTYGSDTESPEQRRERAKTKVGEKKAAARKAAVKTAVGRAKAKAAGAAAGASIAASVAKDTARRAARTATHKISYGAQKKKEQVKSGVKSLIGKGLRKAAGAVGKVAQKAAGAASRLGEDVQQVDEMAPLVGLGVRAALAAGTALAGKQVYDKAKGVAGKLQQRNQQTQKAIDSLRNSFEPEGKMVDEASFDINPAGHRQQQKINKATELRDRTSGPESGAAGAAIKRMGGSGASLPVQKAHYEMDNWDLVLEYLITNGHADTNAEALYVMSQMNEEMVQSILEQEVPMNTAQKATWDKGQKLKDPRAQKIYDRMTGPNPVKLPPG